MKRFIFAVLSSISILIVSCYNEQIDELNSRVDKIEIEKIATIQGQVASISTSILDIQKMSTQLHGYITTLQNQSTELEESLASVEKKIEDVESELKNYMNAQKVQILATLEEYKRLKAKSNDLNLIVGDYVIAYGVPGVVYDKNHIIGLKETSANWSSANSWCSSYGDGTWYLPNRDELKVIYNNKSTLNNTLTMCGGATLGTSYYWSSTDYNNYDRKYSVDFSNGSSNGSYKSGACQVRAVRAL